MLRKVLDFCLAPYRLVVGIFAFAVGDSLFYGGTDSKLVDLHRRYPFFPNLWATDLSEYQKRQAIYRFEMGIKCKLYSFLKDLASRDALVDWLLSEENIEIPPGWESLMAKREVERRILQKDGSNVKR